LLYNVFGDVFLIPIVVKNILIKLEENGFEAYLVGGFVRDYLLNRNTNDFDIATNALPKDVIEIFGPSKKKIEYGSYNLKLDDFNVDITTYRKEEGYKNCKPVNLEYTSNLILDAKRRDFTINALYMNKNGEIIDPLEVLEDTKKKKLKMIGNSRIRFQEDPVRILRAIRFACIYDLKLDKDIIRAIKKEKKNLHPIMTFMIMIGITIILSGVLHLLEVGQEVYNINSTTLEYSRSLIQVENLFSLDGLIYIFSETVSNFVNFAPLSSLIILLIGFGVMEKSGFLETCVIFATKKMKKNLVTFFIIFLSIIASLMGDISYIIMLPLSALIFKYGKRNPLIGIVASFAGLTCGSGLSFIFTSVDSSLLSLSLLSARVIDIGYRMASISGVFIMSVAVLLITELLTSLTEKVIAPKFKKMDLEEEEEMQELSSKQKRGLFYAGIASSIYVIIFLYNIIPGLPFSGNLLDNSQILYVDKLFSYNSFFANGFVFIVTIFFIILGSFYGIGAKTIKNQQELVDTLGHFLN